MDDDGGVVAVVVMIVNFEEVYAFIFFRDFRSKCFFLGILLIRFLFSLFRFYPSVCIFSLGLLSL